MTVTQFDLSELVQAAVEVVAGIVPGVALVLPVDLFVCPRVGQIDLKKRSINFESNIVAGTRTSPDSGRLDANE